MTSSRLWVGEAPDRITLDDFIWRRQSEGASSLQINTGPDLGIFGTIPHKNRDAVWLSTAVFLKDRTVPRPTAWERDLQITVPVTAVDAWSSVGDRVAVGLTAFSVLPNYTLVGGRVNRALDINR